MKDSVTNPASYKSSQVSRKKAVPIPTERGSFPLGVLAEFRQDPLNFFVQIMRERGDFVKVSYGAFWAYHVTHPDYVMHILLTNHPNYNRNKMATKMIRMISGESLITSDGAEWLRRRRLLQPAFHRQRINGFASIITESTNKMLNRWADILSGQALNVDEEISALTFRIVGLVLFGVDLTDASSRMGHLMKVSSKYAAYRSSTLLAPPLWVPTRRNREFKAALRLRDSLGPEMVRERRAEIAQNGTAEASGRQFDMIDLLLEAHDEETGEGMSDEHLSTEINVMLGVGHETTANTLSWTLYALSQHPEVEAKLRSEIDNVLGKRTPVIEDLAALSYMRKVLNESMRLYPAGWFTARHSIAADQFGPYTLPANASVMIPQYAIHRHPEFWNEPERFDPERFTPEAEKARHRFAFIPFGGGPHQCLGQNLAMLEAQLVLAMVMQRYQLRLVQGHVVEPQPVLTLQLKHGLMMTLEKR